MRGNFLEPTLGLGHGTAQSAVAHRAHLHLDILAHPNHGCHAVLRVRGDVAMEHPVAGTVGVEPEYRVAEGGHLDGVL